MKLLRNPVVVGILALVAVVMVLYQVLGDKQLRVLRLFAPKPATAATSAPAKSLAQAAQTAAAPNPASSMRAITYTNLEAALLPTQGVDEALVEQRFQAWVSAPLRDPFLLLAPVVQQPGLMTEDTNSPVAGWVLQAIWNQTDSRLAVINDRVWHVGDVIVPGYKLIRIEQDEVWVQGPYRNERLGFPESKRAAPKSPQPNTKPPGAGKRI
jgi:hypothetical protein